MVSSSRTTFPIAVAATLAASVLILAPSSCFAALWPRIHSASRPNNRHAFSLPNRVGFVSLGRTPNECPRTNSSPLSSPIDLRGGAVLDDSDDEDSDEEDDDDLDLEDDDDFMVDEMEVNENDFAEDSTVDRFIGAWKKTPPLTKMFLQASFATTLYGYLMNKNEFPSWLSLEWKPILTRLQVWRLLTAFLNLGPFGLGYVFTAHFVWTYMSTLERLSHDKPYDFWIMILFGQLSMVIGYPLLKLSPRFLGHNLSTYLVYIWARYHEGVEVNLFEMFNTRAELLPWFFLAQTFLLEGEPPILDFLGIAFGHVYHHCKTVGLLQAPPALRNWYHKGESKLASRIRDEYKEISSDFEMV